MDFASHHLLAETVARKMKVPFLDAFVEGSVLPDYVDDMQIRLGTKWITRVLGNPVSPSQHFCRPIGRRKYNGYCVKRDPSWPREVKPPAGDVSVTPLVWRDKLGIPRLQTEHPMVSILSKSSGKKYTQVTFCTAPVYGGWIADQVDSRDDPVAFWRAAGAIAHLAADLCVWHHIFLCLFRGHQAYEGNIREDMIKANMGKWPIPDSSPAPMNIRTYLESLAETMAVWKSPPPTLWAISHAFAATCEIVRWASYEAH